MAVTSARSRTSPGEGFEGGRRTQGGSGALLTTLNGLCLCLAICAVSLLASSAAGPLHVALLLALAAWQRWRWSGGGGAADARRWWWEAASLAALVFFIADLFVITRDLVGAALRLLVFIVAYHADNPQPARRARQTLGLTLIQMIAASASTTEVAFSVLMTAYLAAALWTLAAIGAEGKGSGDRVPGTGSPDPRLRAPLARMTLGAAPLVLAAGLVIFFVIPHYGTGYFRERGRALRRNLSGFSERIELGSIGSIKKSHATVMRIQRWRSEDAPPLPLRLRGVALDRFNGRAWDMSDTSRSALRPGAGGEYLVGSSRLAALTGGASGAPQSLRELLGRRDVLALQILLEPLESHVLFTPPGVISVATMNYHTVFAGRQEDLYAGGPRPRRVPYRTTSLALVDARPARAEAGPGSRTRGRGTGPAESDPSARTGNSWSSVPGAGTPGADSSSLPAIDHTSAGGDSPVVPGWDAPARTVPAIVPDGDLLPVVLSLSERDMARFLQLPDVDSRVAALRRQVTRGLTAPEDRARALESWLIREFAYSLDVNDAAVGDPLVHLLVDRQPGHCEYFATALAVLLRLEGIPSRIVTGFNGGEFSDLTGQAIVRQSDAHSWVEAWMPARGWITLDPTPPDPASVNPGLLASLWSLFDEAEIAWDTYIVGLDMQDQQSALEEVRDGFDLAVSGAVIRLRSAIATLRELAGIAEGRLPASDGALGILLLVVASASVPIAGAFIARRVRRARSPLHPATALFRSFERRVTREGAPREAWMSPAEFARLRHAPDVASAFEVARYGHPAAHHEALARLRCLVLEQVSHRP